MRLLTHLAMLWLLYPVAASAGASQADFSLPDPRLNLWATHYFVHEAPSVLTGVAFKDAKGVALSDQVSPRDWCLAAIEGTVRTKLNGSPKTLNYGGTGTLLQVDCASVLKIDPKQKPWINSTGKSYFVAAAGAFGDGASGYRLVPYRTIAVDKAVIPLGTVVFVPKAVGVNVVLPDGSSVKHDGYFFAADTGGAIKGNHVDVFCGISSGNCFPQFIASKADGTFGAVIIRDPAIVKTLDAIHRQ